MTVQEHEAEARKQKELEQEAKRVAEERHKHTLRTVGEETRKSWSRTGDPWLHWVRWISSVEMLRSNMRRGTVRS